MSALGQKQTFALHQPMSALPPESGHLQCSRLCPLWAKSGHSRVPPSTKRKPRDIARGFFVSNACRENCAQAKTGRNDVLALAGLVASHQPVNPGGHLLNPGGTPPKVASQNRPTLNMQIDVCWLN